MWPKCPSKLFYFSYTNKCRLDLSKVILYILAVKRNAKLHALKLRPSGNMSWVCGWASIQCVKSCSKCKLQLPTLMACNFDAPWLKWKFITSIERSNQYTFQSQMIKKVLQLLEVLKLTSNHSIKCKSTKYELR